MIITPEKAAELAAIIWEKAPNISEDRLRWHTSGRHIKGQKMDIATAIEDACECLDIDPAECGIEASIEEWQEVIMDDMQMISAMAKFLWLKLKDFGHYAFTNEPNWELEVQKYLQKI